MTLFWGGYLNVVAYRLLRPNLMWRMRSFCPYCDKTIAWHDTIPLFSWIILKGKCRTCSAPISVLYPFIEIISALTIYCLYVTVPTTYFWPYFVFFSALLVTLRTDLETMLISRFMTLALVPLGVGFSILGYLPISWYESIIGSILGYGILWAVAKIFKIVTSKDGLGEGDMELMALVGAFLGPLGCWITLLVGSIFGSIIGLLIQVITKQRMIPFGPFLALGAITYVLLETQILLLLF